MNGLAEVEIFQTTFHDISLLCFNDLNVLINNPKGCFNEPLWAGT